MATQDSIKTITLATIFEYSRRSGGEDVYRAWSNMMREQGREIADDKSQGWGELPEVDKELDMFIFCARHIQIFNRSWPRNGH